MIADTTSTESPRASHEPKPAVAPGDFAPAAAAFEQLQAQAIRFLQLEADRVRLKVRRALIAAGLGALAAMVGLAVIITAVALALKGLADAIDAALGGTTWAGELIIGGSLLALLALGVWAGVRWLKHSHFERTKAKYERWRQPTPDGR
jgi:hypothetical protein